MKEALEVIDKGQKLFLEISKYEQRIDSKTSMQQRKNIEDEFTWYLEDEKYEPESEL